MTSVSVECVLYLGYALFLALVALLLELVARHAHRRSATISTIGFIYHPERDIWQCPQNKHLFPIFSDSVTKTVIYRAPAEICNRCPSKAACTASTKGRTIERKGGDSLQYGMQRFHRAISLTLLALAVLIVTVEIYRNTSSYPRSVLVSVLCLFAILIARISSVVSPDHIQKSV